MLMVDSFEDYADLHGVDADSIRAAAEDPRHDSAALQSLASELGEDEASVVEDIEGAIVEGTRVNPREARVIALDLAQKGEYAVGLLLQFAAEVEEFDGEVEELNSQLLGDTMDMWRAEHNGTPTSEPLDDPRSYDEIKGSIKAQLMPLYRAAVEQLDTAAETVATSFEQGATDANVKRLILDGYIPLAQASLWSQLTFTDHERERALANGAETTARAMLNDLIDAGLVDEEVEEDDRYFQWLMNAAEGGTDYGTILDIVRDHEIQPSSFDVLSDLEEIVDRDGKSYFLLPDDISGDDARQAVIMTYIYNAGTDYGSATDDTGTENDFDETSYSSDEIQRIIDRQEANSWSYDDDVDFVHRNGGRMVTTPNGILMGAGGNSAQGWFSWQGGTAWGDIFMVNIDNPDDEADMLRQIVESGVKPDNEGHEFGGPDGPGGPGDPGALDLDRLLHHEERHAQQWAEKGYGAFIREYAWEQISGGNETEEEAGLSDGGYH
ncbi:hypothetical protein ACHAAC_01125 [Aeromicrobium sp. CF4.19]|uniref:hypothetical protein n=1 Tax=Aeromicrobium sp. CF4.19 TaxID=3373082 RepID=UPI003EE49705